MNTSRTTKVRREANKFVGTIETALGVFTGLVIAFVVQQVDNLAHAEFQLNSIGYSGYVPDTITSAWDFSQSALWATVLLVILFIAFLVIPRVLFRKRYRLISVAFSVVIFVYWVLLLFSSMLAVLPSADFGAAITPVTPASQEASAALTQIYSFFYVATYYLVAVDSIAFVTVLWAIAGVFADYRHKVWVLVGATIASILFWYHGFTFISLPTVISGWGGTGSLSLPPGPGRCFNCGYNPSLQLEFQIIYYVILVLWWVVCISSLLRAAFQREKLGRLGTLLERLEERLEL